MKKLYRRTYFCTINNKTSKMNSSLMKYKECSKLELATCNSFRELCDTIKRYHSFGYIQKSIFGKDIVLIKLSNGDEITITEKKFNKKIGKVSFQIDDIEIKENKVSFHALERELKLDEFIEYCKDKILSL